MMRIDLRPTLALHESIHRIIVGHESQGAEAILQANQTLRSRGITFGGEKEMPIALSALVLTPHDRERLADAGASLHRILEKVVDYVMSSRDRQLAYSPDHERMLPYLRRTMGSETWQLFSRYDAVISPDGRVCFIECNTGCPAGFMHAVDFTRETRTAFESLGISKKNSLSFGMIRPDALPEMLLRAEKRSGLTPGLIALVTDENSLKLELDLIERGLQRMGRECRAVDARTLSFEGGALCSQGKAISVAFQKIRISTPSTPNHGWKPGFEDRYAALLTAIQRDAVVAVNNLTCLTVAEDKGVLAHLHRPEIRALLTDQERAFVDDTIPWTARLSDERAPRKGEWIDPRQRAIEHQNELVIKPAHEGRGFEVHVGRETPREQWRGLCTPNPDLPMVVQDFIEPLTLPVPCLRGETLSREAMHVTIALAMVDGVYEGILSRISPSVVTNVGRQGFVQAVFVSDSPIG